MVGRDTICAWLFASISVPQFSLGGSSPGSAKVSPHNDARHGCQEAWQHGQGYLQHFDWAEIIVKISRKCLNQWQNAAECRGVVWSGSKSQDLGLIIGEFISELQAGTAL